MATVELAAMLSGAQAARRLGVSVPLVRRWGSTGRLPAVLTPLGRLYCAQDVDRLQRERAAAKGRPMPAGNAGS